MTQFNQVILKKMKTQWKLCILLCFVCLLILTVFVDARPSRQEQSSSKAQAPESIRIDQYTPAEHSLYPIQLLNHEAISAVIGTTAIVQLYDVDSNRLIVKGLKLIRSPESPETFIAIVPDQLVASVIQAGDRVIAVLKNPNKKVGTEFVNKKPQSKRLIFYGREQI